MAEAKPLHLRLFLEGIEVPVISGQVSINLNGPATAAIQVVPLDEVLDLRPRTMVHLFYYDVDSVLVVDKSAREERAERTGYQFNPTDPPTSSVGVSHRKGTYKLLFSGEFIGFSYIMTPVNRAVVLQCTDFTTYWDTAKATVIDLGLEGNFTEEVHLEAGDTSTFWNIPGQSMEERLMTWIRDGSQNGPATNGLSNVRGLAGGIIRVLEAVGGTINDPVTGSVPKSGINDFFTFANLRCRILEQITAEENDSSASHLLSEEVFHQWIRNEIQTVGKRITFRDLLLMLMKFVHYDFVPNPVAKYDATVESGETRTKSYKESLSGSPEVIRICENLKNTSEMIDTAAIDGSDYARVRKSLNGYVSALRSDDNRLSGLASRSSGKSRSASQARQELAKAISVMESVVADLSTKSDTSKGGVSAKLADAVTSLRNAISQLQSSSDQVVVLSQTVSLSKTDRLRSQILRPDCWFSSPPKCNIIFPEVYASLNYERNFLVETTRILIQVYQSIVQNPGGPTSHLLADKVVEPATAFTIETLRKSISKEGYRHLMAHELHTGINAEMEWLPDTLASINDSAIERLESGKKTRSWAQKTALYLFFKKRFKNRTASLGGRFYPNAVCGFPAVVILRPYSTLASPETDNFVLPIVDIIDGTSGNRPPAQLLGMIAGINHSIGQEGGITNISLTHVRKHSGADDEFLDSFAELKKKKFIISYSLIAKDLLSASSKIDAGDRAEMLTFLEGLTPKQSPAQGAEISTVSVTGPARSSNVFFSTEQDLSNNHAAPPLTTTTTMPIGKGTSEILVPLGSTLKRGDNGMYGKIEVIRVIDPGTTKVPETGNSVFNHVIVYEEVEHEVPVSSGSEMVLKPNWLSMSYDASRISEDIYQKFFGCDAITEDLIAEGLQFRISSTEKDGVDLVVDPQTSLNDVISELNDAVATKNQITVEKAINYAAYAYGLVKRDNSLRVDEHIRTYNYRPIATLEQVLGTSDLSIETNADGTISKIRGSVGFHTMAVHPDVVTNKTKFCGLMQNPAAQFSNVNSTYRRAPLQEQVDVRKDKRQRALHYALSLQESVAIKA